METSPLICSGFYMIMVSVMKELKKYNQKHGHISLSLCSPSHFLLIVSLLSILALFAGEIKPKLLPNVRACNTICKINYS